MCEFRSKRWPAASNPPGAVESVVVVEIKVRKRKELILPLDFNQAST
jgi:hypothetical protein